MLRVSDVLCVRAGDMVRSFWPLWPCSLFTMLFSVCFLKERVTITKILGVAVTCVSLICTALT